MRIDELGIEVNYLDRQARKEAYLNATTDFMMTPDKVYALKDRIITALKSRPIWRGIPNKKDFMLVDPTKGVRPAANTANYVNELVSHWWQGFPPRNQSVICTTSKNRASHYGNGTAHRVLPFDNPTFGVCSTHDFWNTIDGTQVSDLNWDLNRLFEITEIIMTKQGMKPLSDPTNYKDLLEMIHLTQMIRDQNPEEFDDYFSTGMNGQHFKVLGKPATLLEYLRHTLQPNGVTAMPLSSMEAADNSVECWFSGPALLVSSAVFDQFEVEIQLRSNPWSGRV